MTGVERQILRAVRSGHGTLRGRHLLIDGCHCCDQIAARRCVDNRWVGPIIPVADDHPVLARLTDAGERELAGAA